MKRRVTNRGGRGSALLLAIVMTMLLFVIGMAFMISGRTEKETVAVARESDALDTGVQAVISQINTVLTQDLLGLNLNSGMLDNTTKDLVSGAVTTPGSNEFWDYPSHLLYKPPSAPDIRSDSIIDPVDGIFNNGNDQIIYSFSSDPWLATLEPEILPIEIIASPFFNNYYGFRHITDLYGSLAEYFELGYAGSRDLSTGLVPNNALLNSNCIDNEGDRISFRNLRATIITDRMPAAFGYKADADGDGVADARWVVVPGVKGRNGETVYAAVRIIDNGGMLNINTAFRYPDPTTVITGTPEWDGTQLSHINMVGFRAPNEVPIGDNPANDLVHATRIMQARTFGIAGYPPANDYAADQQYEFEAGRRQSPLMAGLGLYTLFDLTDELDLRNRFSLVSTAFTRYRLFFPVTSFNNGRQYPYNNIAEVPTWFDYLTPDRNSPIYTAGTSHIGNYNRRIITTAYNLDRAVCPRMSLTGMPSYMQTEWNNWIASGAKGEYNLAICPHNYVLPTGVSGGPLPPTNQQIALIAAAIWQGLPENMGNAANTHSTFRHLTWGDPLTRERVANMLAVNLIDYIDDNDTPTDYSPNGNDHYYGYEPHAPTLYISRFGLAKYNNSGSIETYHALALYNPGPATNLNQFTIVKTGAVNYTYTLPTVAIANGSIVTIIDTPTAGHGFEAADGTEIDSLNTNTFDFQDSDRLVVVHANAGYPTDAVTVGGIASFADPANPNERHVKLTADRTGHRLGEPYQAGTPEKYSEIYAWNNVADFTAGTLITSGASPFGVNTAPAATPAVSAPISTRVNNNMMRNLGEIYQVMALSAMRTGGAAPYAYTPLATHWQILITALGGNITSDIHVGRLDPGLYDTTLTPPYTYDNIMRFLTTYMGDGIDNNGDGIVDDSRELSVPGRININTAPWFVIAQLPWIADVSLLHTNVNKYKLAEVIVAYREKLNWETNTVNYSDFDNLGNPISNGREAGMHTVTNYPVRESRGFSNIGELLNVTQNLNPPRITLSDPLFDIRRSAKDSTNNDLAANAIPYYNPITSQLQDDLVEEQIYFQRVSNLVTVRSDVFTAYIAVRLGETGPVRRVIAIFDRSNVFKAGDKPRLVALQPVPDPQ